MYAVSKIKATLGCDNRRFALQQNDMSKHISNRLHYFKNLQKQFDAHGTKSSSIALRKQWLDNQKKINYQSEYDRIRSEIAHNVVKGVSTESLKKRQSELQKLGANAIA